MPIYKLNKPTLDGRSYYARVKYTDVLGNKKDYKSIPYKTKKEALNDESNFRLKINNHENGDTNITIKEIYIKYYNKHKEEVKVQTLEKINNLYKYISLIEKVKINNITLEHINILKSKLNESKLSVTYKNKVLCLLKVLINFSHKYYNCSDKSLIYVDKYRNINEFKEEMKFFTLEEYKQFDSVISDHNYHTFFEILFFLGLRQGELQALTFNDIDYNKQEVKISKTLTTKIKKQKWTISTPKTKTSIRTLPIPKSVYNDLILIKNKAIKYKDYKENWFIFGFTEPFRETTIQVKKNEYCKLAGIKQIRIHDFRHSCASLLINHGASITLVSKYLGHSDINTTLKTYTHLYRNELDNIKNMLDNI